MTRLREDARRLRLEIYPQVLEVRAAFADVDSFRHLNNVALARFFEEGRATFTMSAFGVDAIVRPSAVQLLLAGVVIDYVSQGEYPGLIQIGTGVSHIGRTSYSYAAGLFQNGRCIALCDAVMVHVRDGEAAELPAEAKAALEPFRLG